LVQSRKRRHGKLAGRQGQALPSQAQQAIPDFLQHIRFIELTKLSFPFRSPGPFVFPDHRGRLGGDSSRDTSTRTL
jgi:hypothetical protein